MPISLRIDKQKVPLLVLLLFFLLVPLFTRAYLQHILILILLYAYLGQSWNILGGYTGQLSLGHAAFFGIGAYVSSLFFVKMGLTPWFGLVLSGFLGMLMGGFEGYLSFRFGLKGPYFVLVTLAFAEILRILSINWDWMGGAIGVLIPLQGNSFFLFQFAGKAPYYYIILGLLIFATGIVHLMEGARLGKYLIAIRENEDAAEAVGVNTARYKLYATLLSAGLTAMGGTFYAQYMLFIDPEICFGVSLSIDILLCAIVGGTGTLFGPVLGSFILTPLSEFTRAYFGKGGHYGLHVVIYGAILVAVILFLPHGVINWVEAQYRKFIRLKDKLNEEDS